MYKQDEQEYEEIVEEGLNTFQDLVKAFLAGAITLALLRTNFSDALRLHFTKLMLAGLAGRQPDQEDIDELNRRIDEELLVLGAFITQLGAGEVSPNRAIWRAGMYAPARGTFIQFTVPFAVTALMPGLPGDICLGDGLCKCFLETSFDDEGNASVYWIVSPETESCVVCLDMQSRSPFTFSAEELAGVS